MKFTEEVLVQIEYYIQALDESVGLKIKTIVDIRQAINRKRGLVKKLSLCGVMQHRELLIAFAKDHFKNTKDVSVKDISTYVDKYLSNL